MATDPGMTTTTRTFNICHSNAQSIFAHLHDLSTIVHSNNIHVLGISESFLKPGDSSTAITVSIPQYNLYRADRTGRRCGGVAIYVHESISVKEVCRSAQPEIYSRRPEFLFLELTLGPVKILCGTVYSPPKAGYWLDVEEAILNCNTSSDFTVIMGDFNIDWLSDTSTRCTLSDSLASCCLEPLPLSPTHHTDTSHSTIDYVCVSDTSKATSFRQEHMPSISKHDILFATLSFVVPCHKPKTVRRRSYRNFSLDKLLTDLIQADWSPFYSTTDVNAKVEFLTHCLMSLYDRHAPYQEFTPKKDPSPWMTPSIQRLLSDRDKAWRDVQQKKGPKQRYNRLRNAAKLAIRNAKYNYYKGKLKNCTNSKEMWKVIGELGATNPVVIRQMPSNLDAFNRHFIGSTGPLVTQDVVAVERPPLKDQFAFETVSDLDVLEAFGDAHSNALGVDRIPLRHLTDCVPAIMHALLSIFDTSLQSGVFPRAWKQAIVRPLPKTQSAKDPSQFRPISILCSPSKILERVAYDQIARYVSAKDLLDEKQSGFRKAHSTHTAVIKIVDDIRSGINDECVTLLVGIDFSLAFDLVNIDLLIMKLQRLGFSDGACKWIRSFLTDRTQVVAFPNGETSCPLNRTAGVPQGSLLGPPLFSLFINDLPRVLSHCTHHLYADDFVIYCQGKISEIDDIIRKVNLDLASISRWATDNGLRINEAKTQAMWVGSRGYISQLNTMIPADVTLNGVSIQTTSSLKVLGLIVDSTLSWREQCNATARKCFATLARLRRCQGYLPACTKLLLVKALIFPYLDYCAGAFLDLSKELTTKLGRCKNAALRFATGVKIFEHITPTYKELGILKFSDRRDYLVLCLLSSVMRSWAPKYLKDKLKFIPKDKPGSKRRSRFELVILGFDTECLRHSFYIGAAYLWNDIPHVIRARYKEPCFKGLLYKHVLSTVNSD